MKVRHIWYVHVHNADNDFVHVECTCNTDSYNIMNFFKGEFFKRISP